MADKKIFLGEALVKEGLINANQLNMALEEQKRTGELVGHILIRMNFIKDEVLARFLGKQMSVEYVDLTAVRIEAEVIKMIPEEMALHFQVIPLSVKDNKLSLAMSNPQDIFAIDEIRRRAGCEIEPKITTFSNINYALDKYYGAKLELREIITNVREGKVGKKDATDAEEAQADARDMSGSAPAIQLVDQLLVDSVKDGASDIHIEPQEKKVVVRFRVDGILREVITVPKHMQEAIISRIKVMSSLDIAERRIPQDGRLQKKLEGHDIDVRVAIYPVNYGEKIVLRILDRSSISFTLAEMGFEKGDLSRFEILIKKPYGIILVTGPTGSGKTTTLYAALEKIKSSDKNLVTIEDPIEYELAGINQSQVNPKAGLNFAILLRALMRQDPDIILVGEIRDMETAEVAIRSALTGHLVLATLHTNDAPSSITRITDMGIEPFLVSASTVGVMAQRLIRVICPKCKEKMSISKELAEEIGIPPTSILYHGKGCENCRQSGYKGRLGIFEIMVIDDEIRELINKRADTMDLKKMARQKGMRTLREDGIMKALQGITTIEEVLRVTDKDQ